jgi:glutamyl-tRNA synthetase
LDERFVEKTIPLIRERIKKLSDYLPLCQFIFEPPSNYEIDITGKKDLLKEMVNELEKISDWKASIIGEAMQNLVKKLNIKAGDFFMILRIAITGKKISPPLNESMEILGKEECLRRIKYLFLNQ